jgi:hypothetical protein
MLVGTVIGQDTNLIEKQTKKKRFIWMGYEWNMLLISKIIAWLIKHAEKNHEKMRGNNIGWDQCLFIASRRIATIQRIHGPTPRLIPSQTYVKLWTAPTTWKN